MIKKLSLYFLKDSLYRNSMYLMASTAVMAFFGFFFWTLNARIFSPEQVGIATTLISVASLITNFSLLGFNTGIIRYLPNASGKNNNITTSFIMVSIAALLISVLYLFGVSVFSPKLSFVRDSLFLSVAFVFFILFAVLNTLAESIYIAYRSAGFVLFKSFILSILKLLLPLLLIGLGAFGIFASVSLAGAVAFLVQLLFLVYKFQYKFHFRIDTEVLKLVGKFSFINYINNFIAGLPSILLPILITNKIGPAMSAFFYIAMMIANLLYIIPLAATQSLLAEGSHNEAALKNHLKRTVLIIALLLVPGILLTFFFGNYVLLFFGKSYVAEGMQLLRFLAISGIFSAIGYIANTLLNIFHKSKTLLVTNTLSTVFILTFCSILMTKGLFGVGLGFLLGEVAIGIIQGIIIMRMLR